MLRYDTLEQFDFKLEKINEFYEHARTVKKITKFVCFFITATKTVLDIKIDVSMLTNIPVSKQVWRGWPESIADELSLAQIGISKKHKLYVKPKDDTSRNVSNYKMKFPFSEGQITLVMFYKQHCKKEISLSFSKFHSCCLIWL